MLYIISGASRSGKTTMAERILEERRITYMSLDWLVMGFTNGIPELGIHDKLFPDEIAHRSWAFLKAMFESMIYVETDCVIDGEAILPELIADLREKYPDKISICFIGYSEIPVSEKVRLIKKYHTGSHDWLNAEPDDYITDHVKNMIAHSKKIKQACAEYQIRYFDTSQNFEEVIEEAIRYLVR